MRRKVLHSPLFVFGITLVLLLFSHFIVRGERQSDRRVVPVEGYIGLAKGETVTLAVPLLTRGSAYPAKVTVNGTGHPITKSFSVTPAQLSRDDLQYRTLTTDISMPSTGKHTLDSISIQWSDGITTKHPFGELVLDVRDTLWPGLLVDSYLAFWSEDLHQMANDFRYQLELLNNTDRKIVTIELAYEVKGFEVTRKSTHVSATPTAAQTTSVLFPNEKKDYRFSLKFLSGRYRPFFLFKPMIVLRLDNGGSVLRSGPLISYLPTVAIEDLPTLWDMAR